MIEFAVPQPPSANRIWRHGKGRVYKSQEYVQWLDNAYKIGAGVVPIEGPVRCDYYLPSNTRRDLDNFLKPINDLMEMAGILKNDKQIRQLWVDTEDRDDVRVVVTELDE